MEPNKYYGYFKPSYLNGFENLVNKDLNIEYLQAFEGICRDEFTPNFDFISSPEFINAITENEMIFTPKFVEEYFDEAFHRTTNTQFLMNPNFEQRYLSPIADKPQCFVYVPDQFMQKYIYEIKEAILDYTDSYEFVYTNDKSVASKYLFLDEYPDVMPYFLIVDKSRGIPLRSIDSEPIKKFEDVMLPISEIPADSKFIYTKFKEPIFMQNMKKEIEEFLNKYLEGKMDPFFQTERMVQRTNVKEICSDTFEREIIKNPKVEHCIIQVFKHD